LEELREKAKATAGTAPMLTKSLAHAQFMDVTVRETPEKGWTPQDLKAATAPSLAKIAGATAAHGATGKK
jgi:hypothetical protein